MQRGVGVPKFARGYHALEEASLYLMASQPTHGARSGGYHARFLATTLLTICIYLTRGISIYMLRMGIRVAPERDCLYPC